MPAQDEVEAVAVLLPPSDAARVVVELWCGKPLRRLLRDSL